MSIRSIEVRLKIEKQRRRRKGKLKKMNYRLFSVRPWLSYLGRSLIPLNSFYRKQIDIIYVTCCPPVVITVLLTSLLRFPGQIFWKRHPIQNKGIYMSIKVEPTHQRHKWLDYSVICSDPSHPFRPLAIWSVDRRIYSLQMLVQPDGVGHHRWSVGGFGWIPFVPDHHWRDNLLTLIGKK